MYHQCPYIPPPLCRVTPFPLLTTPSCPPGFLHIRPPHSRSVPLGSIAEGLWGHGTVGMTNIPSPRRLCGQGPVQGDPRRRKGPREMCGGMFGMGYHGPGVVFGVSRPVVGWLVFSCSCVRGSPHDGGVGPNLPSPSLTSGSTGHDRSWDLGISGGAAGVSVGTEPMCVCSSPSLSVWPVSPVCQGACH